MAIFFQPRLTGPMSRREFLRLSSLAAAGVVAGCAANPVTGRQQLMLMSEGEEIALDKQHSPLQFSTDYGTVQDKSLNAYIDETGKRMAARTHRPAMPYSFRVVNATYVNAYAFPGGSIAATRGILLKLDNEAELASLLGHELGHVNARHTAQQMTTGTLTQAVLGVAAAYAGSRGQIYGTMASSMGMIGAGALLASYSRENEREADSLGMGYLVDSGYSPKGFVGLMEMLDKMKKHDASAFELMFATHPMSEERYRTAVEMAETYRAAMANPLHRDRYMDRTSGLRAMTGAIEAMQQADAAMNRKQFPEAETLLTGALKQVPEDYTALVMMAKCQLALNNREAAERYAQKAKQVYPEEAQGYYLSGLSRIMGKQFDAAYSDFSSYDRIMPGNPSTTFYRGLALEGMGRTEASAKAYYQYLQVVREGDRAAHAYKRLVEWGYVKK